KKSSAKRQKVTNSESRESSSDFTSEEPEWLKNSQSVTGTSVSIPIDPLNSEVTPQPESTQSQGTTERVFVTPFYVDLDAYREELQLELWAFNIIMESLTRERRVDNVMGIQVGHIPKDVAAVIASLIDNGEIKLEGIIRSYLILDFCFEYETYKICIATIIGNRGTYSIPLQLHVYGSPNSQESISSSLKKRGIAVESPKQPRQTKKSRAEAAARATFDEAWRDLVGRGQEISMKKKQEAFEKIGISIEDLEKLPEAPQPDALLTNLLPYQKQGLGWMLSHEHPEDPTEETATQFWVMRKVSGSNLYYNVATSYSSQTRPEFSRGGILADDMGLGKTLQTISLIVSDTNGEGFITTPSPTSSDYSKTTLIVDPSFLSNHDVVITTYQVLASSNVKDKRKGLFAIKWRRVVLDEGHIIRTNKTKQSQAACALDAERRWVLSGTPIMNQLNDMYSLVKFLKITPFHDYDLWTRVFSRPVSKGDFDGIDRLSCLIRTTCLRRTKDMKFNGRSILDLPPITSYLHKVKFTSEEKKKYDLM
ncbi:26682_t:CDS:10, partial [Racocetra persica]